MERRRPDWIRHEFPHPIASAWHSFLEGDVPDGMAALAAVEVALRFVSAVQVANLLAEGATLPRVLSQAAFKKPSMGTWLALVKDAGKAIERPIMDELSWRPERCAVPLEPLDELVAKRNDFVHAGLKSATWRREVEGELVGLAEEILGGLEWLGRTRVVVIMSRREVAGRMKGRIKEFHSYVPDPVSFEREWDGDPMPNRVYLAWPDSADRLLDLEPFLRWTRLKRVVQGKADERAPVEALCLWNGFDNGKVLLSDDRQDLVEPMALDPAAYRFVPCRLAGWSSAREDGGRSPLGARSSARPGGASAEARERSGADKAVAGVRAPTENPFAEHPFLPGFVDRFCRGEASEEDLAMLEMLAKNRAVSVRALIWRAVK